jgi:hypothetical protein
MPPEEVVEPSRDVEMLQPASGLIEQRLDSGIVKPILSAIEKPQGPHSPRVIYDVETDEQMDTEERQMEDRILAMDLYYTYDKEIPSKTLQKDKEKLHETLRKVTAKKAKQTTKIVSDQQINVQMDDYGLDFVRPDLYSGSNKEDFPQSNLYSITDLDPITAGAQPKNQEDLFEEIKEDWDGDQEMQDDDFFRREGLPLAIGQEEAALNEDTKRWSEQVPERNDLNYTASMINLQYQYLDSEREEKKIRKQ